jgi:hypothetical protein
MTTYKDCFCYTRQVLQKGIHRRPGQAVPER